ncbi:alpha/beta fold hydrolase [Propionicicella superfundia]|uniref:alpha/beta fold hydrolase n=1 Tax=Propionicicella superfundia TaxID=348582 RepID=UPI0003F5CBCA|nr:alpha/beta hydrolase [Propionicicella superfundia]
MDVLSGLSQAVDGFRLAYERTGRGPGVVLLHGWPGDRTDYRDVVPLLAETTEVVVADLRGFGESDKHVREPAEAYSVEAQARSVLGLIEELGLDRPVIGGYDIGSRIGQQLACTRPDVVRALVLAPPLPGLGQRVLDPTVIEEFWYQSFHHLDLADRLVDGKPDAVRAYLEHFWRHWSGPGHEPAPEHLEHLVTVYGAPGAFTASIGWYRSRSNMFARAVAERSPAPQRRIAAPTTVLWPENDPLYPRAWSDRLGEHFSDVRTICMGGVGHYVPVEAPAAFAAAVLDAVHA